MLTWTTRKFGSLNGLASNQRTKEWTTSRAFKRSRAKTGFLASAVIAGTSPSSRIVTFEICVSIALYPAENSYFQKDPGLT